MEILKGNISDGTTVRADGDGEQIIFKHQIHN